MSVRIGHASGDENGKARGGKAGDQTGKEVCIRNWYNKGWKVLLRAKDPAVRKKIAQSCIAACKNDNSGYDQGGRNTLLQEAQKVDWDFAEIDTPNEADCSSLATACVQAAGVDVWDGGNAHTTQTLERALIATGAFEALRDEKYLTGTDYLLEGDILLKPGSHVVMVLDNGELAEIVPDPDTDAATDGCAVYMPVLAKGMSGDCVKVMQILLVAHGFHVPVFGKFDDRTEEALRDFKKSFNLKDAVGCDTDTWCALLGLTGVG